MELTCYLHEGWRPKIRPAEPTRPWMDQTPESFAYRCLPLNIANAHGWEILAPAAFDAYWNGGAAISDVIVQPDLGDVRGCGTGLDVRRGRADLSHPGAVPHAAGLEPAGSAARPTAPKDGDLLR